MGKIKEFLNWTKRIGSATVLAVALSEDAAAQDQRFIWFGYSSGLGYSHPLSFGPFGRIGHPLGFGYVGYPFCSPIQAFPYLYVPRIYRIHPSYVMRNDSHAFPGFQTDGAADRRAAEASRYEQFFTDERTFRHRPTERASARREPARSERPESTPSIPPPQTEREGAELEVALTDEEFFTRRIEDIYFDFDKYDIRPDAAVTQRTNAQALQERPSLRILIEGHCDERGSEKYNLALGDRRANATKQVLIDNGITPDRLETISYGEERLFCTRDSSEECHQENRKAHFSKKD
ncbi:MAG: OmpA family protein [Candidatus Aenigmarchaeota archaeon]|nr:OmpA family protein [Candidatus Aenigmarchaeota archaeon]